MRNFSLYLIIAMAAVACDGKVTASVTHVDGMSTSVETTTPGISKFSCIKSGSKPCYFLAYTSSCIESAGAEGKPAIVCTTQLLDQFQLSEGESKEINNAAKVLHCVSNLTPPELAKCSGQ